MIHFALPCVTTSLAEGWECNRRTLHQLARRRHSVYSRGYMVFSRWWTMEV